MPLLAGAAVMSLWTLSYRIGFWRNLFTRFWAELEPHANELKDGNSSLSSETFVSCSDVGSWLKMKETEQVRTNMSC